MRYIVVTHIDKLSGKACTEAPMRKGPAFPNIKGLRFLWDKSSAYPIQCESDGRYKTAPEYYCTCDDDADTTVAGVLEVINEEENNSRLEAEMELRPTEMEPFNG